MALQAVSHDWMADVCTCVDFLREELSWRDAMDRLLYQMTHEFDPDFKEFIPIYLERYICLFRNAYFKGCCCETNFRLEMHLYNYCMNGANLAIAFESLM